jgi:hypothetical protein
VAVRGGEIWLKPTDVSLFPYRVNACLSSLLLHVGICWIFWWRRLVCVLRYKAQDGILIMMFCCASCAVLPVLALSLPCTRVHGCVCKACNDVRSDKMQMQLVCDRVRNKGFGFCLKLLDLTPGSCCPKDGMGSIHRPTYSPPLVDRLASCPMLSLLMSAKVIEVVLQPLEANRRSSDTCQGSSRCKKDTSVHDDFIASIIEAISYMPIPNPHLSCSAEEGFENIRSGSSLASP